MNYNKSRDLRVHRAFSCSAWGGENLRSHRGDPCVSGLALLALSFVTLSTQHLALLVLAHLLAAFLDDTTHAIPSSPAPVGASGRS